MTEPLLPEGCLVFDIGASYGTKDHDTSGYFLKCGAGKVIAVEASIDNFNRMAVRENVINIHGAISEMPGVLPIHTCIDRPGLSTGYKEVWSKLYSDAKWSAVQWTPAITLDQLILQFGHPHLIKIDVEGGELSALYGLSIHVPLLIFEFHWWLISHTWDCLEQLAHMGFRNGTYYGGDVDLSIKPLLSFQELKASMIEGQPDWGNIVVS